MIDYDLICKQAEALAEESAQWVPLMANISAILYDAMSDVNWVGFYVVSEGTLLLGPFQGKIACVRIEKGKGVCGTAWEQDKVQLVPDVHDFSGHIACDSASRSEIVVPIHKNGEVAAVLDIDSPVYARFSEEDSKGLQMLVKTIERVLQF